MFLTLRMVLTDLLLLLLSCFSRVWPCVTPYTAAHQAPRPWDSQGKNSGVGCHFLLQCVKVKSLSHVWLFATQWTAAHQAPPSMGFSRQEYWSGVPLLSPLTDLVHLKTKWKWKSLSHVWFFATPWTIHSWNSPGQSTGVGIGVSASASVLLMNIQDWFPLEFTGLISLQSKGLSRVIFKTTVQKHQFFGTRLSLSSNSYIHTWLLEKP